MMNDVERLVANISPIITDIETFKLLCLITLFTGVGDTIPTIARLRNRYCECWFVIMQLNGTAP